ncbi:alpha-mannosyltransferase KNAG_0J02990 [Huiozyma naganishii CBS 8797]|uniref:Glycosyltransferase family 71 protein n=1 Tax=Huiozyma naganishii (strain ATCC MYA-139 / BCRC 22969 / CBS 8797 / KCTC 17520 / NBRC 10181 / NCYC 3082 / Yp74L-3) TaxID=1071383 RepID=J7S324_HUIN7|nr:hypothetical protein KNAG_0J02990 [Kazachstania naganishii CBS 8797]CCK72377.1 hypothetical protein KNAG_0J02990 [Kazachstania naganishii CBS 8797]
MNGRKLGSRALFVITAVIVLVTIVSVYQKERTNLGKAGQSTSARFSLSPESDSNSYTTNPDSFAKVSYEIDQTTGQPDQASKDFLEKAYSRVIFNSSPFSRLQKLRQDALKAAEDKEAKFFKGFSQTQKSLINWNVPGKVSRLQKCKILVSTLYYADTDWSNQLYLEPIISEAENFEVNSLVTERLRIYDFCFISGGLEISDVLEDHKMYNAKDLQHRMFPFMKQPAAGEILLPTITDLTTMQKLTYVTPEFDVERHNENPFKSWMELSDGKGIVTTFSEPFSDFFFRQLKVLQYQENKLPIQIVVKNGEFTKEFLSKLSERGRQTGQRLFLVEYSEILEEKNVNLIRKYFNKLIANIFNTFEEFVLLDADAVPYSPIESFMELPEYKNTGIYMFRDRVVDNELDDTCLVTLEHLEPTIEEVELLGSTLLFTSEMQKTTGSVEESIYRKMMEDRMKENVETGLVVVNKKEKFAGLVMTLMLSFNHKLQACFHGDKEFYWLGPLFAGQSYSIEPKGAALTGFPQKKYKDGKYVSTKLCDFHIAHVRGNELFWINGGLKEFKPDAGQDTHGYENKAWKMNGVLIPKQEQGSWNLEETDYGNTFCAEAVEVGSNKPPQGEVIWFDEKTYNKVNDIAKLWNNDEKDSI